MSTRNAHIPTPGARPGSPCRGYTLVELLLVISILVLLLAIGIPAFSSMLYSSSRAMAENALRVGLTAARDAALRSSPGHDAAAVFFYEPGGRMRIVPCVKVGEMYDDGLDADGNSADVKREIFVPLPQIEPVGLPTGWTVRAYVPPGAITDEWYEQDGYDTDDAGPGHWVLPETGFFSADRDGQGRNRQTFMVRFEGGTGVLRTTEGPPVLVLDVVPGGEIADDDRRFDPARVADPARYVRRVLSAGLSEQDQRDLLGDVSNYTVLARAVGQLAVMNESRMAAAIGVRLDRYTGTVYRGPGSGVWRPEFVAPNVADAVDQWVMGAEDVRIFAIQRYLGSLQEIVQ